MAIALSHGGSNIYKRVESSKEVIVGTTKGVVILERTDAGWREARRSLPDEHIHAVLVEPVSGFVFAGTNGDGVFASTDGGKSWERRDTGITEHKIYSLASSNSVSGKLRLFVGTEPAKLFASDDLGKSWKESPSFREVPSVKNWSFPASPHAAHLKNINFDPKDSRVVYGSVEQGGLLKSIDGGETWTELCLFAEAAGDVHRIQVDDKDPRHIWAVTGSGLYITANGGQNWDHVTTRDSAVGGYPDGLVFSPRRPQQLFMSAAEHGPGSWRQSHFAGSRIAVSTDGGRTWQVVKGGLPDRMQSSIEALCLEETALGTSLFVATTSGEVWNSDDVGVTWSCIAKGLAPISKGGHYNNLAVAAVS